MTITFEQYLKEDPIGPENIIPTDVSQLGKLKSFKRLDNKEDQGNNSDPNRQGSIRTVKNAHLIYKRQNDTNNYDELWVYKIDNRLKDELDIKNSIISGSDIPVNSLKSENGEQYYDIWHVGNVVFLKIFNLQN